MKSTRTNIFKHKKLRRRFKKLSRTTISAPKSCEEFTSEVGEASKGREDARTSTDSKT